MAVVNDASALFKRVYPDSTLKIVPNFAKLQKEVLFSKREKLGDLYGVSVVLQHEHGFSYGSHGDGAFDLNPAVAGAVQQAQIRGSMIVLRSQLSYEDVFKATESGPAAFEAAMGMVVENMQESFAKRQELAFIYGQRGIGQVSSIAASVITITNATWAPGIWSGMRDCQISFYDGVTGTDTERSEGGSAVYIVTSVSYSDKTVTITDAAGGAATSPAANDHIFFRGARTATAFKECIGIDKILVTTTGTVFNINVANYELWRGQTRAISGAISMLGVLNCASDATNLGLMDKAKFFIAVKRWNSLNSDQAALRRYGAYSAKFENGAEGITYHSTNGAVEIEAHPFVKEGEGFFLPNPSKRLLRVGASDISFRRPGMSEDIFRELTDSAGLELRCFADQAIMLKTPAHGVKATGITD